MRFLKIFLAIVLLTVISGCAIAPQSAARFTPAPPPPEGYSLVYIYRLNAQPYVHNIKISVAGKEVLDAPEYGYTWLYVPAGTHTILAVSPPEGFLLDVKNWPDTSSTLAMESGKAYFFRLTSNVSFAPDGFLSGRVVRRTAFLQRTDKEGFAELTACCRFMQPATKSLD